METSIYERRFVRGTRHVIAWRNPAGRWFSVDSRKRSQLRIFPTAELFERYARYLLERGFVEIAPEDINRDMEL